MLRFLLISLFAIYLSALAFAQITAKLSLNIAKWKNIQQVAPPSLVLTQNPKPTKVKKPRLPKAVLPKKLAKPRTTCKAIAQLANAF